MSAVIKTGHSVFFHSLVISLGVAVGSIATSFSASAQESIVLDFSNPNVSVDFSVLEDGGVGRMATTPSGARRTDSKGYLIPGPKAPVSTLYITPVSDPAANLAKADEDTTKYKFKLKAPQPKKAEPKTEVVKKDIPDAPPPTVKPVAAVKEKSAPELAKEEVVAPPEPAVIEKPEEVAKEKPKEIISAEPEAPKAPPPPPEPVPAPVPVTPVAKAPAAPEPAVEKPVKLEAKPAEELKEEKIAEPVAPPAPPPAVKVPEPPKVVAKLPEAEPTKPEAPAVASLPPTGATIGDGHSMRVLFEADSAKLPGDAREELRELAASMTNQEGLRLQLLAYAGGAEMSSSVARRLSLSRALAVRSYLIENGVRSTRIDVRALGNKTSDTETERVDITVIER